MPAPLRSFLVALWVTSVAGAMVILLLSLGWTSWVIFVISGIVGLVVGIPAGIWSARQIKRQDPGWPPEEARGTRTKSTQS